LEEGARIIRKRLLSGHVALLFGSERVGLSNEDLSHCHWLLRIPAREAHRSVNLGQAVAICLYELARKSAAARPAEKHKLATAGEVERVYDVLLDALRASGYMKPRAAAPTQEKVRRLLHRLHLSASDAEAWLGMLRQIVWKLRSGKGPA
jgi:tRNA/rRNA methyltransferase